MQKQEYSESKNTPNFERAILLLSYTNCRLKARQAKSSLAMIASAGALLSFAVPWGADKTGLGGLGSARQRGDRSGGEEGPLGEPRLLPRSRKAWPHTTGTQGHGRPALPRPHEPKPAPFPRPSCLGSLESVHRLRENLRAPEAGARSCGASLWCVPSGAEWLISPAATALTACRGLSPPSSVPAAEAELVMPGGLTADTLLQSCAY